MGQTQGLHGRHTL